MMHTFLENNREELIARCKVKVAQRPRRAATEEQLKNGVPLFLEQLRRTLEAEENQDVGRSHRISDTSGGWQTEVSEMGVSAAAHGKQLLELGFTVNQIVRDYGDLCQAITESAVERDAPFAIEEFRTLNRCLDNAIADAVTEFSAQRDIAMARQQAALNWTPASRTALCMRLRSTRSYMCTATAIYCGLRWKTCFRTRSSSPVRIPK